MEKDEIFKFLNKNSVATIATIDGLNPRVRFIWIYKSDEKGIMFHTGKMKDLFKQLIINPYSEFCFVNEDKSIQIRVSGKVRLIEDNNIKNEIVSKRPFLKDIEKVQGSLDFLSVFLLEKCIANVWTKEINLAQKKHINLF